MPDAYTLHLLGMAVEACVGEFRLFGPQRTGETWLASDYRQELSPRTFEGPTLAAALEALLDAMGVAYPPEPTAEQVRDTARGSSAAALGRAAVLALLDEGGER